MPEVRSDFEMTLALHSPNRGSGKVGSHASSMDADTDSSDMAFHVPHLIRIDPTGKRLAFFDNKSSRIELRSDFGGTSMVVSGLRDNVDEFRWLKNARGFVVTTQDKAYVGFLTSESPNTITFKPLLSKFGKAPVVMRTIGTGVVVTQSRPGRGKKVFFIPIDGTRALEPQRVASQNHVVSSSVLAGSRIIVKTGKASARKQFRTFSTKGGTLSQIDTTPASKQHYIDNWATGSQTLAYVAHHFKNNSVRRTLFIHAEKLVKARLPDDWRGVSIMWPSNDDSQYLIGSDYQLGLWNQKGKRLWYWSPPDGQQLASASFAPDGSIIASAGLKIYRIKDGKGEVLLRVKGRHPERPHRELMNVGNHSFNAYSFVDHPILMDNGKIGYSLIHVSNIRYD